MKNPTWSRDELIVALDFYLKYRRQIPNKGDREIRELSDRLSTLGRILFGAPDTDTTFRNPNGVYMKMMNFRALDPNYTEGGKRGLLAGPKETPTYGKSSPMTQYVVKKRLTQLLGQY